MSGTQNGKVTAMQNAAETSRQLLVLDPSLQGWAKLLVDVEPDVAVLVLDPARDGLTQVADVAQEFGDLTAIHIAGHGTPGCLRLGSIMLDAETLPSRADELAQLGAGLAAGGALLLWGADIGQGALGARFIAALSRAVGRDVAAAADRTGPAKLGGSWNLDMVSGRVDAHPFNAVRARTLEAHPVLLSAR